MICVHSICYLISQAKAASLIFLHALLHLLGIAETAKEFQDLVDDDNRKREGQNHKPVIERERHDREDLRTGGERDPLACDGAPQTALVESYRCKERYVEDDKMQTE